jgi:hypothetical protein
VEETKTINYMEAVYDGYVILGLSNRNYKDVPASVYL